MGSILWSLSLVSVGFWVCIFSGQFLYGRRRLVGVGMFGIGSLLGAAGILPWGFWW
jgi:hypothetical protein